jgi:endogenous inhibitor of DNA gyrase (YacG/DUF329 family)
MPQIRCPTCGNPFDSEHTDSMPFCSRRCRNIDLGRWLDEEIRLPLPPRIDEDEPPDQEHDKHADD